MKHLMGIVLILCMIMAVFTGCSDREQKGDSVPNQTEDQEAERKELVVLANEAYADYGQGFIKEYLPNYTITYKKVSDPSALLSQILAGDGPDVTDGFHGYESQFDLNFLIHHGALTDLGPLLKKAGFDEDWINQQLIRTCMTGDQLFYFPLECGVANLCTSEAAVDTWKLSDSDFETVDGFFEKVLPIEEQLIQQDQSLFGGMLTFPELLLYSGFQSLNYHEEKAYFNTETYKKLAESYKRIYEYEGVSSLPVQEKYKKYVTDIGTGKTVFSALNITIDKRYETMYVDSEDRS